MLAAHLGVAKTFIARMALLSHWMFTAGLLVSTLTVAAESSPAQSYSMEVIDDHFANHTLPQSASGVNDAGHVAGSYQYVYIISTNCGSGICPYITISSGFFLAGSGFIELQPPGGCDLTSTVGSQCHTVVTGINNADVVVGQYQGPTTGVLGFSWSHGTYSSISFPGADDTLVNGVSNAGVIVGTYSLDAENGRAHGFILSGTAFSRLDYAGSPTILLGINKGGQILGEYFDTTSQLHYFVYNGTTFSPLPPFPGSTFSVPSGINDAGQIIGTYGDSQNKRHGFRLDPGNKFSTIDFADDSGSNWLAINNNGQIAGEYLQSGTGADFGFLLSSTSLLDPVPYAMNGPKVISDTAPARPPLLSGADLILLNGRPVQGVAADGVSQVVVVIPATNAGDQFTVTLYNDQSPATQTGLPNEDGAVGKPGDTSFSASQVTVTARALSSTGPYAFAAYRAPVDFARPAGPNTFKPGSCNGTNSSDDQLACRAVTIQVQNLTTNTTSVIPVQIVRPPVLLIHGLWSKPRAFSNFFLNSSGGPDQRFFQRSLDYSILPVDPVVATAPDYTAVLRGRIRGNSLGFDYNAPKLMEQMSSRLQEFKSGINPISAPVAAIQADIVAHSMGGNLALRISRSNSLSGYPLMQFERNDNFGQGDIHKLITIDTPYLGSPLPLNLLLGSYGGLVNNNCVRNALALAGDFSLVSASFVTDIPRDGAAFDLQGDGLGSQSPSALTNLTDPFFSGPVPLPTALIAATANAGNLSGLDTNIVAKGIKKFCGDDSGNPLALDLTSTGWPNVFGGVASDAVVPLTSQLNRKNGVLTTTILPGSLFSGYIHGTGVTHLGFLSPTVLDAGPVPAQVITLLNTPVTDPAYNKF